MVWFILGSMYFLVLMYKCDGCMLGFWVFIGSYVVIFVGKILWVFYLFYIICVWIRCGEIFWDLNIWWYDGVLFNEIVWFDVFYVYEIFEGKRYMLFIDIFYYVILLFISMVIMVLWKFGLLS